MVLTSTFSFLVEGRVDAPPSQLSLPLARRSPIPLPMKDSSEDEDDDDDYDEEDEVKSSIVRRALTPLEPFREVESLDEIIAPPEPSVMSTRAKTKAKAKFEGVVLGAPGSTQSRKSQGKQKAKVIEEPKEEKKRKGRKGKKEPEPLPDTSASTSKLNQLLAKIPNVDPYSLQVMGQLATTEPVSLFLDCLSLAPFS